MRNVDGDRNREAEKRENARGTRGECNILIIARAEEISHRRACRRFRVHIFFGYLGDSRWRPEIAGGVCKLRFRAIAAANRFAAVRTGGCLLNSEINISSSFFPTATRARARR